MLSSFEAELFKAVASEPFIVPRQLVSPETNLAAAWFETTLGVRAFSAIAHDALLDRPTNIISILQQSHPTPAERTELIKLWTQGKANGSVDIEPIVNAMRDSYIARETQKIFEDYNHKWQEHPDLIRDYLHDMGASLAALANDGLSYNPDPVAHYDDIDITIGTSWGCDALDVLYGGVPNRGYGLFIAPSGFGKSSFSRSLAVYSLLRSMRGESTHVLLAVNEMTSGFTSRGIRDAARDLLQYHEVSHDVIDENISRYIKLYEDVYTYSRFEQMLFWHRPNVAVIDSLDALGYPPSADKYKNDADRHQARAIGLHEMSAKYGCFIIVPANASGENQFALKQGRLDKIYNASAFGSAWYENKATYATVMTWDVDSPGISLFKDTKNRPMGQAGVGRVIPMQHSYEGHYYRDAQIRTIDLNA
jgi:hypothetical protein